MSGLLEGVRRKLAAYRPTRALKASVPRTADRAPATPSSGGIEVHAPGERPSRSPRGKAEKDALKVALDTASSAPGPTEDESQLATWVNDCHRQALDRQRREYPHWYIALSYLANQQFVWYNEIANVVEVIPRINSWEIRIPINKLRTICERILADLVVSAPRWMTAPTTSTERGYIAARSWQHWYDSIWAGENVEQKLRDQALLWSLCAGRGWARALWEADRGEQRTFRFPVDVDGTKTPEEPAGDEMLDLFGGEEQPGQELQETEETYPEGQIGIHCPCPLNVFTDHASNPEGPFRWLLEASRVHVQEVKELYGVEVQPDCEENPFPNYSRRVWNGINQTYNLTGSEATSTAIGHMVKLAGLYSGNDDSQTVLLKEMWIAPTKQYAEGRYIVVADGKVLKAIDNPYGRIPYVPFIWFPRPGSDQCDGFVPQVRPLQDALNRTFGRMLSIFNFHAAPPWIVEDGTVVDMRCFSDRPNNVIVFKSPYGNGQGAPKREQPPNFTANSNAVLEWIEREMEELGGVHSASRGENPEGNRSAVGLQILQAADRRGRDCAVSRYKESLTELARLVMEITRRFVVEEKRQVSVVGPDDTASVIEFTRADIEHGRDVRVTVGGYPPLAPEERVNAVASLTKAGYLDLQTPQGRKVASRILEHGDLEAVFDRGDSQERLRIHKENLRLLSGEQVQVRSYDKHEDHGDGHAEFFRSEEAQRAFRENPGLETSCQEHLNGHIDYLNSENVAIPFRRSSAAGAASPGAGGAQAGAGRGMAGAA